MFKYVAAVAVAVSVIITPFEVRADAPKKPKNPFSVVAAAAQTRIDGDSLIKVTAPVADPQGPYYLSKAEQGALRRALFRSVRILD